MNLYIYHNCIHSTTLNVWNREEVLWILEDMSFYCFLFVKLWFSILLLLALIPCQIWLYFIIINCMFVWVSVWNWWRNVKNRATHKWLASGATRERSHKEHMLEVEVFECDGISWVTRNLANSQLDLWDVLPVCLCVFPYFFIHTI